jgi:outer membrane protein assembly factor BamB
MSPDSGTPPLVVLSFDKCIVAVHARTGQHAWQHAVAANIDIGLRVDQDRVFCVGAGVLACLNYLDGSELWSASLPDSLGDVPNLLLHAGCVILMSRGEAMSFARHDGTLLWHDRFKGYGTAGGSMAAPGVASPFDRTR